MFHLMERLSLVYTLGTVLEELHLIFGEGTPRSNEYLLSTWSALQLCGSIDGELGFGRVQLKGGACRVWVHY